MAGSRRSTWAYSLSADLAAEPDSEGRRPFFAEQADISGQYEIMSIPFCVLIDKEGRIVARWQHTEQEQLARISEIME